VIAATALLLAAVPPDQLPPTPERATGYDVSIRFSTSQLRTYEPSDCGPVDPAVMYRELERLFLDGSGEGGPPNRAQRRAALRRSGRAR
jgi:hypothetical protein